MRIKYWMLNKIQVSAENTRLCYPCCTNFSCINQVGSFEFKWQNPCCLLSRAQRLTWGFRWGRMQAKALVRNPGPSKSVLLWDVSICLYHCPVVPETFLQMTLKLIREQPIFISLQHLYPEPWNVH